MVEKQILEQGFMEFASFIPGSQLSIPHDVLLKACEDSQIHTFGWPIGVVLHKGEFKPKPYANGIKATIHVKRGGGDESFDYWNLKRNGDYYLLKSLFEDMRSKNKLFVDTRIVRITETLLHTVLLYKHLGVQPSEMVNMRIRHGGLKGRELSAASPSRYFSLARVSQEDIVISEFSERIGEIEKNIHELVYKAVSDITVMFDFFKLSKDEVVIPLVNNFMTGRVG